MFGRATVKFITENRMPERRHVHPQLVGTPGYRRQFNLCRIVLNITMEQAKIC